MCPQLRATPRHRATATSRRQVRGRLLEAADGGGPGGHAQAAEGVQGRLSACQIAGSSEGNAAPCMYVCSITHPCV